MYNYDSINSEYDVEWCVPLKKLLVLSKHQLLFFKTFLKSFIYLFQIIITIQYSFMIKKKKALGKLEIEGKSLHWIKDICKDLQLTSLVLTDKKLCD